MNQLDCIRAYEFDSSLFKLILQNIEKTFWLEQTWMNFNQVHG